MKTMAMRPKAAIGALLALFWLVLGAVNPVSAAATGIPQPNDDDADGMDDSYELFYGLNPAVNDAQFDYDGDGLANLQESNLLTDPFEADTDRDGWNDLEDENPISRAFIPWGVPQFTSGDIVDYACPDWFRMAYKSGGEWIAIQDNGRTNESSEGGARFAWRVDSAASNEIASLNVDLDRTILTNNLVYALRYWDGANASLFADLLDTNGAVVAKNLYGNLLEGANAEAGLLLDVPIAAFTNAAVIQLRHGGGEVVVFQGVVYIDSDGDGLDLDQEIQLGTSDRNADSNGNGIGEFEECFQQTNSVAPVEPQKPTQPEDDEEQGNPTGIIYVDQSKGNDAHTGRAASLSGKDGPKKTVSKGMAAVNKDQAHTLVIKSGIYNENLNISGKKVKVVIEGKVKL